MEKQGAEAATAADHNVDEIRCSCGYFLLQRILVEGKVVLKLVCKSCKSKSLVTLTPTSTSVGRV